MNHFKRWYEERKASRLCIGCGDPAITLTLCKPCRDVKRQKQNIRDKAKAQQRKAA